MTDRVDIEEAETQRSEELKFFCPDCGDVYEERRETCPKDGAPLQAYRLADADEQRLVGDVLDDRFRITEQLGAGGMGCVYRSVQLSIDRDVALKVLHSDLSGDETVVRRFFREARLISECSHPNIVGVVDFGQDLDRGALYLAMEMVDGTDLRELISMGRFAPELALEIVRQTCGALADVHERGIVHRDLKPENLMATITSDRALRIKVVDFGIAHALQADQRNRLTATGMVYGTPTYMAPEQAEGREVGPEADIYALGVILFELLTGRTLFEADHPMRTRFHQMRRDSPRLRDVLPPEQCPDALDALLERMLRKSPDERPDDILEVRDTIESIQRDSSWEARLRVDTREGGWERFEPWIREPVERTWGSDAPSEETDAVDSEHSKLITEARHTGDDSISPTRTLGDGAALPDLLGGDGGATLKESSEVDEAESTAMARPTERDEGTPSGLTRASTPEHNGPDTAETAAASATTDREPEEGPASVERRYRRTHEVFDSKSPRRTEPDAKHADGAEPASPPIVEIIDSRPARAAGLLLLAGGLALGGYWLQGVLFSQADRGDSTADAPEAESSSDESVALTGVEAAAQLSDSTSDGRQPGVDAGRVAPEGTRNRPERDVSGRLATAIPASTASDDAADSTDASTEPDGGSSGDVSEESDAGGSEDASRLDEAEKSAGSPRSGPSEEENAGDDVPEEAVSAGEETENDRLEVYPVE